MQGGMMDERRRKAIFPGTFDPVTNGHVDIIERGLKMFSGVLVAVARSDRKDTLFSLDERVEMVRGSTASMDGVEVVGFEELLVDLARRTKINVVIRGLRVFSDFEYELQMALMNRRLSRELEAVFLMPLEQYTYLTSTLVKEIFALGGDVSGLVPAPVEEMLGTKLGHGS
jgi:pantetheine-phosphate adenylyltransferase